VNSPVDCYHLHPQRHLVLLPSRANKKERVSKEVKVFQRHNKQTVKMPFQLSVEEEAEEKKKNDRERERVTERERERD